MLGSTLATSLRRKPARLGAVIAVVLTLGLSGCGSDGATDASTEESSSETTDDATTDATTEDAESPAPTESEEGEAEEPAPAEGEAYDADLLLKRLASVDQTTFSTRMQMTASGLTLDAVAQFDPTQEPPAFSMTMTNPAGAGDMKILSVGGAGYTQIPGVSPAGKWLKTDELAGLGVDTSNMDSAQALDKVSDAITEVKFVGDDEIDGDDTEHFVMTVDSSKIPDASSLSSGGLPKTLTYDIWVDGDDRVRKMTIDMGDVGRMETIMSGYGDPVDITAPPAKDVIEQPGG